VILVIGWGNIALRVVGECVFQQPRDFSTTTGGDPLDRTPTSHGLFGYVLRRQRFCHMSLIAIVTPQILDRLLGYGAGHSILS
jgi:hypothetical protein